MTILLTADMDGTLLRADNSVDSETKKSIARFNELAHIFIIATGRLDHDITYIEEHLNIKGGYRISQNGALIRDQYNRTIFEQTIAPDAIKMIVDFLTTLDLRVEASTLDNRYFSSPRAPGEVAEYYDSSIILENFNRDVKRLKISTFLIFGDESSFQPIRTFLEKNLSDVVDGFMTSPSSFEIVAKGVNKGMALEKLLEILDERVTVSAAIGDSENDASMFSIVDKSFAVENASDMVKSQAGHVSQSVGTCIDFLLESEDKS